MIRDIATVMRGTLVAQLLGFLALPLLARLFEPAAFGHYQLFISILTFLLVFSTLRYEVALLRARDGLELRALFQLCMMLIGVTAAGLGAVAVLLNIVGWPLQIRESPFSLWLLFPALLFGGLAQFLTTMATRQRAFGTIATSKIVQGATYAGTGLGIGAASPFPAGLIAADVLGRTVQAAYLAAWARRTLAHLWRPVGWAPIKVVARRYREYPYISVPGTAINVLGGVLTPVMIYASFSAAASGQYALLDRSVGLPLSLIVVAVGQVFTAQFAAELRNSAAAAAAHFRHVIGYMSILAAGVVIILLAAGPWLFSFIFGEEWRLAGQLAQIMAPAFASTLLSGPVHMVLTVMGHQKLQTAWEVSRLTLVAALWLAAPLMMIPLKAAVGVYSVILVLCNLGFVALAFLMLRRSLRKEAVVPSVDPV